MPAQAAEPRGDSSSSPAGQQQQPQQPQQQQQQQQRASARARPVQHAKTVDCAGASGRRRGPPPPPLPLRVARGGAPQAKQAAASSAASTSAARREKPARPTPRSESTRRLVQDLDAASEELSMEASADELGRAPSSSRAELSGSSACGSGARLGSAELGAQTNEGGAVEQEAARANQRLTWHLVWAVLASAVGSSFQHGYNGGVVNAPERLIGDFINATHKQRHGEWASEAQVDLLFSLLVSIFCIGGCLGALLTALVAEQLGRKEGLIYNNLLVLLAAPLMASARPAASPELLVLGRFLIGLNAGLNAGLAPLYLNEIAPCQLRGALGTIYQLVITISILLSNLLGLPNLLGNQQHWPYLFAVPLLPAGCMLAALPHCPESPKHLLLRQGKELQAQQALAWLRETGDVHEEMEELRNERELQSLTSQRSIGLAELLGEQSLRRPLTIGVVIMLSQQLSGINAILFYSTSIFRDAGLSEPSAVRATLGMSLVNVLVTLLSLFLVDRAGRRTLHMTGLMGMAATCLLLALCLGQATAPAGGSTLSSSLAVLAVYVFVAMFASGPGAIPWFLVAELFPSNARPLASSIAVAVNWLANFTVSLLFLPLTNLLHGFVFVLFALLLVLFYLFTYFKVPETKGATAEEISALFRRN